MQTVTGEPMTGSLRWGYLAAYLVLQNLFAGGLLVGGVLFAWHGGIFACAAAIVWGLIGGYWLLAVWREAARAVSWFRLDGETLFYRTVGSSREKTIPLSAVQKLVLYRTPRHS